MSLGSGVTPFKTIMDYKEECAWNLYCEETAGSMDVRDFWWELPKDVQQIYLDKVELNWINQMLGVTKL